MKYIIALILLIPGVTFGQDYPRNYFITPLDTPLIITGGFGEIRNEHLHTGIDISTNEEEGLPVHAAAEGYVSRVKIEAGGYGKAIYITHPNGYVTVYAHMQKFTAGVNDFIRNLQYQRQSFELDEKFKEEQFPVRKRDVIGYSGSTGGADGPHLHFEIRDERTEEPINPFLFGIPYNDHVAPEIKYIRIIPQREGGFLNGTDTAVTYDLVPDKDHGWRLNVGDYPVALGNFTFAISATDQSDGSDAVMSVYTAELFIDDQPIFTYRYDRLNFDHLRDVNAHIDYLAKKRDNQVFERFSRLPGDRLEIYPADTSFTGRVTFDEDKSHEIKIIARDFKGNKTEARFVIVTYVSAADGKYQPRNAEAIFVGMDKGLAIHKSAYDVVIPEGASYDDFYYDDEVLDGRFYSNIYRFGDEYVPLRKPMMVGIKPDDVVDSLKKKLVIARIGDYDIVKSLGGEWNGKMLQAKSNTFGRFTVMLDTTPPVVEKYYTPADMNGMYGGEVRIRIVDQLSGIKTYSGKVDGKWRLFEYDKKSDMLIANVDNVIDNKDHPIEITVTDERGNTTVWKSSFYF